MIGSLCRRGGCSVTTLCLLFCTPVLLSSALTTSQIEKAKAPFPRRTVVSRLQQDISLLNTNRIFPPPLARPPPRTKIVKFSRLDSSSHGRRRRVRRGNACRATQQDANGKELPDITVVGLGPSRPESISLEVKRALEGAEKVYARTKEHPAMAGITRDVLTFDSIYDESDDFATVYHKIASVIVEEASKLREQGRQGGNIVYAVPGDPSVAEASVRNIRRMAEIKSLNVQVLSGISFVEPVMAAVGYDILPKLVIIDALDIASRQYPPVSPGSSLLITQIYRAEIASEVKLCLGAVIDEEKKVALVHDAGGEEESVEWVELWEIDHDAEEKIGLRTALFVPGEPSTNDGNDDVIESLEKPVSFEDLVNSAFIAAVNDDFEEEINSKPREDQNGLEIASHSLTSGTEGADGTAIVKASDELVKCLARAGEAAETLGIYASDDDSLEAMEDGWDAIEAEERELTQAFGNVLAELMLQVASAKEAGLLGEYRISDVVRAAKETLEESV